MLGLVAVTSKRGRLVAREIALEDFDPVLGFLAQVVAEFIQDHACLFERTVNVSIVGTRTFDRSRTLEYCPFPHPYRSTGLPR